MKKNIFYITLASCTVVFTGAAVFAGMSFRTGIEARTIVSKEIQTLETENGNLKNREEILEKSVSSKEDETDEKDALNKKIVDVTEKIETVTKDTEAKRGEYNKLTESSKTLSEKLTALTDGMRSKVTSSQEVSDRILMCPSDIDEGRYKISGDASFSITSSENTVSTAEDLNAVDTGTYIFEIAAGEKIKIEGDASLDKLAG